jgi:hypothetical protein
VDSTLNCPEASSLHRKEHNGPYRLIAVTSCIQFGTFVATRDLSAVSFSGWTTPLSTTLLQSANTIRFLSPTLLALNTFLSTLNVGPTTSSASTRLTWT